MKLTLTQYSKDGLFQDRPVAEFGINCPYAIKLQIRRWCLTIYRWKCPTICFAIANSDDWNRGGELERWAYFVLYQDHPWRRFHVWRTGRRTCI